MKKLAARIDTTNAERVRDRAPVELLYSSGIRAAELLGLDVADVDLTNCTAIVTGTRNEQRVVPTGKTAMRILESYVRGVRPFLGARHERTCAVAHVRGKKAAVAHALEVRPSSR